MTVSKVMKLRMLPLDVWLTFDGANRWGIPAARIMAATMIGLKSGSLKALRERAPRCFYGWPSAAFCDARLWLVRRGDCVLDASAQPSMCPRSEATKCSQ
jgi:hypothetical protein